MADVFVSYKRDDQPAVQRLVQALRGQGFTVWWDQDIEPSAPWELTIERELQLAKAVIVAWSPMAVVSESVKAEARHAQRLGKLVQAFIAPCDPPLFFGERQGVDLSGWGGNGLDRRFQTVVTAARAVIAGEAPPEGVGYATTKRRRHWRIVAGVFAASVAGLAFVGFGLRPLWSPSTAKVATTDPAAVAAHARQKLLQSVNGAWDRQGGSCATPIRISTASDNAGVVAITVSGPNGFRSTGQVIAADGDDVMARAVDPSGGGSGETWEYQPNGALMTVVDGKGVHTPLVRCQAK
jgi:TIR domain